MRRSLPALLIAVTACGGATPHTSPRPAAAEEGAATPVPLARVVAWANSLPATRVRVRGRLRADGWAGGALDVEILATRALGLRLTASGPRGFELASDGLWVQGRDTGGALRRVPAAELPEPACGRWGWIDPWLLVEALLPPPLPSAERLAATAALAFDGPWAVVTRLRPGKEGVLRPVRRLTLDARTGLLARDERFDGAGRRIAWIEWAGRTDAPWPFPARVRLASSATTLTLEVESASRAGPLAASAFRLASAGSQLRGESAAGCLH